jgi:hypothetical protein
MLASNRLRLTGDIRLGGSSFFFMRAAGQAAPGSSSASGIYLKEKEKVKVLEARVGIEPTHKGFADLSLTTWVPRLALLS